MALDDYTSGGANGQSSKENKREFDKFTRAEFEECLAETEHDFEVKKYDWTWELVYEAESDNGKFSLRVYSSIDQHTDVARDKGSDAIRTTVIHNEAQRPVLSEKRTNRIKTWPKNLKKKIQKLKESYDEVRTCSRCGSTMVIRKNMEGTKFYGCTSYPECNNTQSIDDS
jgi:hypothetical protein